MAALSDYLKNKLADFSLGGVSYSPPGTVYVAAYTTAPTSAGGGVEVSGNAYARVALTNDSTNWPNASGGVKSNGTIIQFPEATGSWGTIVAFGIFDASSGGNLLFFGALTSSKSISTAEQLYFPVNAQQFTWS